MSRLLRRRASPPRRVPVIDAERPPPGQARSLRQALGPGLLGLLVVGDILGAGIYILVGEVAADVGGMVWLPFLLAFGLAVFTATSYVELVSADPHAAGSAHYVDLAFGRPMLTFLVGYVVAASAVSTAAAVSRAVGGQYLGTFFEAPVVPVALVMVLALSVLTWIGVAESARATAVMTVVEVAGLLLVIVAGALGLLGGAADPSRLLEAGPTHAGASGVVAAAALAFFAYLGFEDVVHLSEEVRDPRRAFPRALLGGLAVVGVLYMGVTISVAVLVDPAQLARSSAPLLEALEAGSLPIPAQAFALIAIVAVTNTALLALTTASRQIYGLAEKGSIPPVLGRVGRRRTPTVAIIGVAIVVAVLVTTGGVRDLADTTVALLLGVFTMVNITVLVLRLRRRRENAARPRSFRAPTALPVVGALGSALLLGDTLIDGGLGLFIRLGVLVALGLGLYALTRLQQRSSR
jgi:amino acid transporter